MGALGQWLLVIVIIVFIVGLMSGFTNGGISHPASNLTYTPISEGNLSTTNLSQIILQPTDVPVNFKLVEWRVADVADVTPFARNWGWKKGFIVRYQLIGSNASYGTIIYQGISLYPIENITRILPSLHPQKLVNESNGRLLVDVLPDPGIGDNSMATRTTVKFYNTHAYAIDFVKKDVYEEIVMDGTTADYETVKNLAKIAADKIN